MLGPMKGWRIFWSHPYPLRYGNNVAGQTMNRKHANAQLALRMPNQRAPRGEFIAPQTPNACLGGFSAPG